MTRRVRGFTLLEVMIALAFIGVALVAVIRAQGQGVKLGGEARFTSRAVFLAQTKLAEAQSEPDISAGVRTGRFDEPLDDVGWETEIAPVPGLPGLFRVQVWVHREDEPARQGLTLQGFIYRETT